MIADLPAAQAAVLDWYGLHGRRLAFRATRDPWAVLVSEAMAQQTQAERAAEAWTRFIAEFPTAASLAVATTAAVLRAWRGLGYNRRALALRDAARVIVAVHDGVIPATPDALRALPGVGPYTARAVAALAFGQPVAAIDTNVRRVLGRVLAGEAAPSSGSGPDRAAFQRLADSMVPADRPGEWTHALMDVGATLCRIRDPRCAACPLQPWCGHAAARSAAAAAAPATGLATAVPARRSPPGSRRGLPFSATSRWLRGRILDRLRDAGEGGWVPFDGTIGSHDRAAVTATLGRLRVERLIEIREPTPGGIVEARLSLS